MGQIETAEMVGLVGAGRDVPFASFRTGRAGTRWRVFKGKLCSRRGFWRHRSGLGMSLISALPLALMDSPPHIWQSL